MAMHLNDPTKPWRQKIGYIKQMWLQPCQTDVLFWVLGSFAAAPVILYHIHEPDCLDYQADRVRAGHKKRRQGSINPADSAKPIAAPTEGLSWVVFKLGTYAQRIGFYMTLIDATLDYVIHMTSFAYQLSGCRDPNTAFANCFFNDTVPFLGFVPNDYPVDVFSSGASHIFIASNDGIVCGTGFSAFSGYTLTQKPFPVGGSKPAWTAYIRDDPSGARSLPVNPVDNPDGTRSATMLWTGAIDVTKAHNFKLIIKLTETGIWYGSGLLTASGDSFDGIAKSFCSKKPLKDL